MTENVTEMDEDMTENDDEFKENTPVASATRKTSGEPTPTLKSVLGQCSITQEQEQKEEGIFDQENQEEELNQIVVCETVHEVLSIVKSTDDKDTSQRNYIEDDDAQSTEMKQMDGPCNTLATFNTVLKSLV